MGIEAPILNIKILSLTLPKVADGKTTVKLFELVNVVLITVSVANPKVKVPLGLETVSAA